jgi:hypothetical protein
VGIQALTVRMPLATVVSAVGAAKKHCCLRLIQQDTEPTTFALDSAVKKGMPVRYSNKQHQLATGTLTAGTRPVDLTRQSLSRHLVLIPCAHIVRHHSRQSATELNRGWVVLAMHPPNTSASHLGGPQEQPATLQAACPQQTAVGELCGRKAWAILIGRP